MDRLNAAKKQTAAMIRNKLKKGELWAVEEINKTIKKELNKGNVELMKFLEIKKKTEAEPSDFTRLNIAYKLDSLSTMVRLIQDVTTLIGSTTLSLEVLTLDNTIVSMV